MISVCRVGFCEDLSIPCESRYDDGLEPSEIAMPAARKRVLLIVGGGIAAYKALELVRLLRKAGIAVRPILTRAGAEFVTPLSLSALCEDKVYQALFSLTDEAEMGHIELSRSADLIVAAPATADLMAKAAHGLCDDLASTTLLATDTAVLMAPAMNVRMWNHPATQANVATLRARGVRFVGPGEGPMACGEFGFGRLAEPPEIFAAIQAALAADGAALPLKGKRVLVTAGPTVEPIDPVRVLTNRSSGKQGYALAGALAARGAEVTLVSGPTALAAPEGVRRVDVETARQMLQACEDALPVDAAVFVAAVADWRPAETAARKARKGERGLTLALAENPDILATIATPGPKRPGLVVGFAAETAGADDAELETLARAKRLRKGCDWILANDVSGAGVMGGDRNAVLFVDAERIEHWGPASKAEIAEQLVRRIEAALA
jgi:phosphopantothenoylcysteine decarboxylase/phosphopantothenate--cysteine ligase